MAVRQVVTGRSLLGRPGQRLLSLLKSGDACLFPVQRRSKPVDHSFESSAVAVASPPLHHESNENVDVIPPRSRDSATGMRLKKTPSGPCLGSAPANDELAERSLNSIQPGGSHPYLVRHAAAGRSKNLASSDFKTETKTIGSTLLMGFDYGCSDRKSASFGTGNGCAEAGTKSGGEYTKKSAVAPPPTVRLDGVHGQCVLPVGSREAIKPTRPRSPKSNDRGSTDVAGGAAAFLLMLAAAQLGTDPARQEEEAEESDRRKGRRRSESSTEAGAGSGVGIEAGDTAEEEEEADGESGGHSVEVPLPTSKLACRRQRVSSDEDAAAEGRQHMMLTCPCGPDQHCPVVLVSPGSFNPPTNWHLRMFELARDTLASNHYDVMGAYMSPVNDRYGKKGLAPGHHRINMCERAAEHSSFLMVDAWEASQPAHSRTLQVLKRIDDVLNGQEHRGTERTKIVLLCGADLLASFVTPGVWLEDHVRTILSEYGVVCITRNSVDVRKVIAENDILYEYRDNIVVIDEWITNSVSSSAVRRNLSRGLSVKYLVPNEVIDYAKQHCLYSSCSVRR